MKSKKDSEEIITLSAVDPLNVVGFILPGARITAISKGVVRLQDGVQVSSNC